MDMEKLAEKLKELEGYLGFEIDYWDLVLSEMELNEEDERKVVKLSKMIGELHKEVLGIMFPE